MSMEVARVYLRSPTSEAFGLDYVGMETLMMKSYDYLMWYVTHYVMVSDRGL